MYVLSLLAGNLTPMNKDNLLHALTITWKGFLAIFLAIALIIVAVKLVALCVDKAEQAQKARKARLEEQNDAPHDGETSR